MSAEDLFRGLPIIGPAVSGKSKEDKELVRQMGLAADAYKAYRPEARENAQRTLGAQAHMFAPVNDMLGQMYGAQAQIPIEQGMNDLFPAEQAPPPVSQSPNAPPVTEAAPTPMYSPMPGPLDRTTGAAAQAGPTMRRG